MAQPQHQVPPRPFSPAQQSPSPSTNSPAYQLPAAKRPRISPGPQSQPASPYSPSPYGTSPGPVTTPSTIASPTHPPLPIPPSNAQHTPYATPYGNGTATPVFNLPTPQPLATPPLQTPPIATPQTPSTPYPQYSNATLAPMPAPTTPGVMGPPSKPPEKQTKEYQYEFDDSLAGTGIDLRQEEQLQQDYFAGTYRAEAKTGFPANPPGSRASFYGAGLANQPAQPAASEQQDKAHLEAAKRAWNESAKALATSRSQEVRNPFLAIPILHARAHKIANDYGLTLNLDPKTGGPGKLRADSEFPKPQVTVKTKIGPDGALISTSNSFIPEDSFLVEQIALLSIATKHRLRELVGDANRLAVTRQHTSHGEVPAEWADAAAPLIGPGQAATRKRSFDAFTSEVAEKGHISKVNHLTQTLRDLGRAERDLEEQRLRRRQQREAKKGDPAASSPATPAAPGTPGSTAGDPSEKAPTKKELKSKAAAKAAEANNTASANVTSNMFLGGKKKRYSWMQQGSGANTPTKGGSASQGLPGTPGAAGGGSAASNALTMEGRTKLGMWREDGEKGKNIHLRDWVFALEADGRCERTLQQAYDRLDASQPK